MMHQLYSLLYWKENVYIYIYIYIYLGPAIVDCRRKSGGSENKATLPAELHLTAPIHAELEFSAGEAEEENIEFLILFN